MKKCILVLVFLCLLCGGCGKSEAKNPENTGGISLPDAAYDFSYKEKLGGSVVFTIKGKWEEGSLWKAKEAKNTLLEVKESQSGNKAQFTLKLTEKKVGYEQAEFLLFKENTEEALYSFTVLLSANEKKLTVVDVFYGEISENEEEATTEIEPEAEAEEEEIEETEKDIQTIEAPSLPEEFIVEEIRPIKWRGSADETLMKEVRFAYKEDPYCCQISDSISTSEFQAAAGLKEEDAVVKIINEVQVSTFYHMNNTLTMWKGTDGLRYYLQAEEIEIEKIYEVIELFLK